PRRWVSLSLHWATGSESAGGSPPAESGPRGPQPGASPAHRSAPSRGSLRGRVGMVMGSLLTGEAEVRVGGVTIDTALLVLLYAPCAWPPRGNGALSRRESAPSSGLRRTFGRMGAGPAQARPAPPPCAGRRR